MHREWCPNSLQEGVQSIDCAVHRQTLVMDGFITTNAFLVSHSERSPGLFIAYDCSGVAFHLSQMCKLERSQVFVTVLAH